MTKQLQGLGSELQADGGHTLLIELVVGWLTGPAVQKLGWGFAAYLLLAVLGVWNCWSLLVALLP